MNQVNIISDVAAISKVPNKALSELISKEILCIGSAIRDAVDAGEEVLVCNIGIGALSISLKDMQCKFTANNELKSVIKKSLSTKIDPLEFKLEQSLIEKLVKLANEAF